MYPDNLMLCAAEDAAMRYYRAHPPIDPTVKYWSKTNMANYAYTLTQRIWNKLLHNTSLRDLVPYDELQKAVREALNAEESESCTEQTASSRPAEIGIYKSTTHGPIKLSFTARRHLQNIREAASASIKAGNYQEPLAYARGELALYIRDLEMRAGVQPDLYKGVVDAMGGNTGQRVAWIDIARTLDEVRPGWHNGTGSSLSQAIDTIMGLAEAADRYAKMPSPLPPPRVYDEKTTYEAFATFAATWGRAESEEALLVFDVTRIIQLPATAHKGFQEYLEQKSNQLQRQKESLKVNAEAVKGVDFGTGGKCEPPPAPASYPLTVPQFRALTVMISTYDRYTVGLSTGDRVPHSVKLAAYDAARKALTGE